MSNVRIAVVVLVLAPVAHADEPPPIVSSTEQKPPREPRPAPEIVPVPAPDHTAREASGAPRPGQESGRTDQVDPGDSGFRILARGVLYVPKFAYEAVLSPVRGSLYLDDRYQLQDLYWRTFYNEDRTIGLFPTATYSTGYSLAFGAGFIDKNLFGDHELLTAEATVGYVAYRQGHALRFRSGNRFGEHVELGLDGNFDRLPDNPFYGIGNSDEASRPAMPIDPLVDSTSVHVFHRYQEIRGSAQADLRYEDFHLVASGAITSIKTSRSSYGAPIDQVYDAMSLVGFDQDVTHFYPQLEARWDTRRAASVWEPGEMRAEGSLVAGFAGPVVPIGGPTTTTFWHYGTELQQFFHLAPGPRYLALRFHGEGVTGSLDEVPFVELPYLGGDAFLRGYTYQRFRDRIAAVAAAQYGWDLSRYVGAYVFVDAGRVYGSMNDLTLSGMRAGFGLGLAAHDPDGGFVMEGVLGSSIDGGLVATLSFSPVLDARARWR